MADKETSKEDFVSNFDEGFKEHEGLIGNPRQYPTVEEFLYTVPILLFDIEGYITDVKGQKDWSADAVADFATRLGIETYDLKSELLGEGETAEWKIRAEVRFIDTTYKEIAEITQPRQIEKTNYQTKEKYLDDDDFSIEKAIARAIRNAKKRAMPAKRLLHMFFAAQKARDLARTELRNKMGFYKEKGYDPRRLIAFAEKKFTARERRDLPQDNWQERHWEEFKVGIGDGVATETGLFRELFLAEVETPVNDSRDSTSEPNNESLPEQEEVTEDKKEVETHTATDNDPTGTQAAIPDKYEEDDDE